MKRRGDNRSRMSESELLRQEAEQLKSVIRVGSGSRPPLTSVKIVVVNTKKGGLSCPVDAVHYIDRLNMELDLQSVFGLLYTLVLIG